MISDDTCLIEVRVSAEAGIDPTCVFEDVKGVWMDMGRDAQEDGRMERHHKPC